MAGTSHHPGPGRSGVRAHHPSEPPEPLTVRLPLDYTAFCLLHRDAYLRYARARLTDAGTSRAAVEAALGQLALIWPTALSSSCPAAVAWRLLGHQITLSVEQAAPAAVGHEDLHGRLPAAQADAVLLCHHLSLTPRQAAALMGVQEPTVSSRLNAARRGLPTS
ncbi:sigma factor-like helix-turn-helix DNA-binding protein [Streptomyces enissocaesilis]|uniref:RNA polymerase sigma factor 70 region 4 type 2 domain-containing protein n=1 Tax=Streptomyces enissocaesilis TaxID=332589 RepID=A0ABP6JT36_9ACTN